MNRIALTAMALLAAALLACPAGARAQAGVAREIIEAAAETLLRQGGKEAARDLAEMGGRVAVKEVLENAAREGGESLVQRTVAYGVEHGPAALRAISRSPRATVAALDGLAPELRGPALRALAREPELVQGLVARFGSEGLEAAGRHPGVGGILAEKLGPGGIDAARSLTTDQAIILARHADEVAALAPAERATFMDLLKRAPGRVVDFLEKHPKTTLAAGGAALLVAAKDDILGTAGINGSAGRPGLVEKGVRGAADYFRTPAMIFCGIVLAGVAVKTAIRVRAFARKRSA